MLQGALYSLQDTDLKISREDTDSVVYIIRDGAVDLVNKFFRLEKAVVELEKFSLLTLIGKERFDCEVAGLESDLESFMELIKCCPKKYRRKIPIDSAVGLGNTLYRKYDCLKSRYLALSEEYVELGELCEGSTFAELDEDDD